MATMKISESTNAQVMTTGTFLSLIALSIYMPTPGMVKICSTITDPPRVDARPLTKSVMMGRLAFLSACFQMTRFSLVHYSTCL